MDIVEKIEEVAGSVYDFFCNECNYDGFEWIEEGNKYDGKEFDIIFSYDGKFYKGTGRYSSWDSTDYEREIVEVVKEQVMVWQWKEVK